MKSYLLSIISKKKDINLIFGLLKKKNNTDLNIYKTQNRLYMDLYTNTEDIQNEYVFKIYYIHWNSHNYYWYNWIVLWYKYKHNHRRYTYSKRNCQWNKHRNEQYKPINKACYINRIYLYIQKRNRARYRWYCYTFYMVLISIRCKKYRCNKYGSKKYRSNYGRYSTLWWRA
jgi:hypothetical protein